LKYFQHIIKRAGHHYSFNKFVSHPCKAFQFLGQIYNQSIKVIAGTDNARPESARRLFEAWNIQVFFKVNIGEVAPPIRIGVGQPFGKERYARAFSGKVSAAVDIPPDGKNNGDTRHFRKAAEKEALVGGKAIGTQFNKVDMLAVLIEDFQIFCEGFGGKTKTNFSHKPLNLKNLRGKCR
jgi:hypothetical protein